MDRKKNQHINFAFEALPVSFLSNTVDFMTYLERDGLDFIKFWWDHVGVQLPIEQHMPFEGIDFKIIQVDPKTRLTIITFPPPKADGEMYFMGLISRPEKYIAWVRLPTARAIGLVRRPMPDYPRGTEIGDLTPRALFSSLGNGPLPNLERFTQIMTEFALRKR